MDDWAAYLAGERDLEKLNRTRQGPLGSAVPRHYGVPAMRVRLAQAVSQPTLWGHASRVPGRG